MPFTTGINPGLKNNFTKNKLKSTAKNKKQKYPGSWLFSKKILEWTFRPELRSQLPFLYKLFSRYSQLYFSLASSDYLKGGRRLFLRISSLNKSLSGPDYTLVKLPGYTICIDLTDPRFLNVINEFLNEGSAPQILDSLLKPGDTFIDIGANHGSFSVIAGNLVGKDGLVVAVEAQERMIYALEKSLGLNAASPYKIFHTAVGNRDGETEFYIPEDTSGSAGVFRAHSARFRHRSVKVGMARFDNLVDWKAFKGKVVIKLDIEGSEFDFLEGARQMIRSLKPVIIMEINPGSLKAAEISEKQILKIFGELGYTSFAYLKSLDVQMKLDQLDLGKFSNIILYAE